MPRYRDYQCKDCAHRFDMLFMTEDEELEIAECPVCGANAEQRITAPFHKVVVKGNHDFVEREQARLTERSQDHWEREGKDKAVELQRKHYKKAGFIA